MTSWLNFADMEKQLNLKQQFLRDHPQNHHSELILRNRSVQIPTNYQPKFFEELPYKDAHKLARNAIKIKKEAGLVIKEHVPAGQPLVHVNLATIPERMLSIVVVCGVSSDFYHHIEERSPEGQVPAKCIVLDCCVSGSIR